MIKESMFLFLLLGQEGSLEKKYIGRLNHCDQSKKIYETLIKTYKNINGYLCLDKVNARKVFQHTPTPKQEYIIQELHELLVPEPKAKPLFLKRRESVDE